MLRFSVSVALLLGSLYYFPYLLSKYFPWHSQLIVPLSHSHFFIPLLSYVISINNHKMLLSIKLFLVSLSIYFHHLFFFLCCYFSNVNPYAQLSLHTFHFFLWPPIKQLLIPQKSLGLQRQPFIINYNCICIAGWYIKEGFCS